MSFMSLVINVTARRHNVMSAYEKIIVVQLLPDIVLYHRKMGTSHLVACIN